MGGRLTTALPEEGKMPGQVHEYYCRACGNIFEEWKSYVEMDSVNCPGCGSKARRRTSRCLSRTAHYDTVVGHDGTILSRKQSTETTPMLPEKVHGGR